MAVEREKKTTPNMLWFSSRENCLWWWLRGTYSGGSTEGGGSGSGAGCEGGGASVDSGGVVGAGLRSGRRD